MPISTNWMFCTNCNSLYNRDNGSGVCGTGRGHRGQRYIRDMDYALFYDENPYNIRNSDNNWRECKKCGVLYYHHPSNAVGQNCCYKEGQHKPTKEKYILKNEPSTIYEWEEIWRRCHNCQTLCKGIRRCPSPNHKKHNLTKSSRWIIEKQRLFQKIFFITSHNSYDELHNASLKDQLNSGVRGIEIDINDWNWNEYKYFEVGHFLSWGDGCFWGNGQPGENPSSGNNKFQDWLKPIVHWSQQRQGNHAPITIFVELKSYTHSNEKYRAIESAIKESIPLNILFKASSIFKKDGHIQTKPWPSLQELRGKIIIVLTSFFGDHPLVGGYGYSNKEGWISRWQYHIDPSCESAFVAWTDTDIMPTVGERVDQRQYTLKNEARFLIFNRNPALGHNNFVEDNQKLIRSDYGLGNPHNYNINFPISDFWRHAQYLLMFDWCQ